MNRTNIAINPQINFYTLELEYIRMEITVLNLKIWRVASKLNLPWNFQIQYSYFLINMYIYDGKVSHMYRRMCYWAYTQSIDRSFVYKAKEGRHVRILNVARLAEMQHISNVIVFGLIRPGINPTIYHTRGQHTNYYTPEAVVNYLKNICI